MCGSVNNGQHDYYGRLDVSWDYGASQYLDPSGGITVWDGYPDGAVSYDDDDVASQFLERQKV